MAMQDVLLIFNNLGLTDVILPFILIFTVIYAILEKSKILGQKKQYNVAISLVISLIPVMSHITGRGPDVITIINNALPGIALWIVMFIAILLLIGLGGGNLSILGSGVMGVLVVLSILIVVFVFGNAAGVVHGWPNWLNWLKDPATQAVIIVIVVFGLIIWFVTREPSTGQGNFLEGLKNLGREFGGR